MEKIIYTNSKFYKKPLHKRLYLSLIKKFKDNDDNEIHWIASWYEKELIYKTLCKINDIIEDVLKLNGFDVLKRYEIQHLNIELSNYGLKHINLKFLNTEFKRCHPNSIVNVSLNKNLGVHEYKIILKF